MKKFDEVVEIIECVESAIANSICTKEIIDAWDSLYLDNIDYDDVEISDEEWGDFCEWSDRVADMVRSAKRNPRVWVYGEYVECDD